MLFDIQKLVILGFDFNIFYITIVNVNFILFVLYISSFTLHKFFFLDSPHTHATFYKQKNISLAKTIILYMEFKFARRYICFFFCKQIVCK